MKSEINLAQRSRAVRPYRGAPCSMLHVHSILYKLSLPAPVPAFLYSAVRRWDLRFWGSVWVIFACWFQILGWDLLVCNLIWNLSTKKIFEFSLSLSVQRYKRRFHEAWAGWQGSFWCAWCSGSCNIWVTLSVLHGVVHVLSHSEIEYRYST